MAAELLSGDLLGAYCLSEAHAGSDPAAMRTKAVRDGDDYVIRGQKAWTTHGGQADFYKVMARTGETISCFLVPADSPGLSADSPEQKMGLMGSTTATMVFEDVRVPAERLLGEEGQGLKIALAGLDAGRLGIAAVATGLAQGALDVAVAYAKDRETFGRPIIEHQGLAFVLADMTAAVESARATYLAAARMKDAGRRYGRQASIAKLVATDNAMKVTTDAVQVLGRRVHARLPRGALHARGQGHADLRGHQPDPATGDQSRPRALITQASGRGARRTRTRPSRTPSRPGPCCSCRPSR